MSVHYDRDADILHLTTERASETGASLLDDPGVVLDLATADGHEIVGLLLMGASAYIPLGQGYDRTTDTLLLGRNSGPSLVTTETGDFVGYWRRDQDDPDGIMDPVGVALRRASRHIAEAAPPLVDAGLPVTGESEG